MRSWIAIVVLAAAACGKSPSDRSPSHESPTLAPSGRAALLQGALPTAVEEITLHAGDREISGTVVAPSVRGPWPGLVLLAGSGPTDRDWNSPLIAGKNGSGKLLADELARHGVVVVRFDKVGTGKSQVPPLDQLTLDTFRDEAAAAVELLRKRSDVRADRIFVAGHSEGGMHATRVAQAVRGVAGVLYLASVSRTMADTMLTQLEGSLRHPLLGLTDAQVAAELASVREALDALIAGRPVDPSAASKIPKLQQQLAELASPAKRGLYRPLFGFDNAAEAAKLTVPILIVNGGKDVQVDLERDARRLAQALRAAKRDVTLRIAPDADHVLTHEPKSLAELRGDQLATVSAYNADGRTIDRAVVTAIVEWLAARG